MEKRRWIVVGLLMIAFLVVSQAVVAEEVCPSVQIRNDSDVTLEVVTICEAAQPWVDKGFQIFIYLTDYDPQSENDWFGRLDQVEADFGIRDLSHPDRFSKSAIAFEATTVTFHPWGHNVTFGEMLSGTPFDTDQAVGLVKGQMKNSLADGEPTAAFVNALQQTYSFAYPPPTPTSKPVPTVVVAAPTTNVEVDLKPVAGFLTIILVVVLAGALLVGVYFFVTRIFVPYWRRRAVIQAKKAHLNDVAEKVEKLLVAALSLFEGESVESSRLWELFCLYGGEAYPQLASQVRSWLKQSMEAFQEAFEWYGELDEREPKTDDDLDEMTRAYEMLWVTIVGTDPAIRSMDERELSSFINPLTPGIEVRAESQLVEQLREALGQMAEQTIQVQLTVVDPDEVDADGLFGYANRVKNVIAQLEEAEKLSPEKLNSVHLTRRAVETSRFPEGLTPDEALEAVDALIVKVEEEVEAERWLNVVKQADEADILANQIGMLLPAIRKAVDEHQTRVAQARSIQQAGYRLLFLKKSLGKCSRIIIKMYGRISKGDIEGTQRSIQNLEDASIEMHRAAEEPAKLAAENLARLGLLAREVARIEAYRTQEVEPIWETLQTYPQSNWEEQGASFYAATKNLNLLFDNPTDEEDLASGISRTNSMEVQDFKGAEQMLSESFAELQKADSQLKAIVEQLKLVRQIEKTISSLLETLEAEIGKAKERRDRDNVKIDAEVDRKIEAAKALLKKARQLGKDQEFTGAANVIDAARTIAGQAYSSADEQARIIDDLFAQLGRAKASAKERVRKAQIDYHNLPPVAQRALAGGFVGTAATLLKEAQKTEAQTAGKEDQALVRTLENTSARYRKVEQEAARALSQIAIDKQEYEQVVDSARSAIAVASSAIAAAGKLVRHSDAGGAGKTSLGQAKSGLPSLPEYGVVTQEFRRARDEAKQAEELAERAKKQAHHHIIEVEEAREAERRRREKARRKREAEERRRREARRAAEAARRRSSRSSSRRSSSWGSSSRSSSFGGSSRSSGFGSSSRR